MEPDAAWLNELTDKLYYMGGSHPEKRHMILLVLKETWEKGVAEGERRRDGLPVEGVPEPARKEM